jgi:hypothetical protein
MTTNKLLIGVGAIALAVTASLSPLVAQAEPAGDTDSNAASSDSAGTTSDAGSASTASSGVGSAAGRKTGKTNRGGTPRATADAPPQSVVSGARTDTEPGAAALGPNPLFQNPLIWIGTPNPDAPTPVYTRTFEPLASLPDWAQSYYGWYRDLNFEACVLGLSNSITPSVGPYGTSTSSISTGGC